MKTVLFIVGSLREKSFNRQLSAEAEALLKGKAEVKRLEYAALPFLNQDTEYPAHPEVARIREEVAAADALWIFSPEYNGSYPSILKSLLDWLSRPVKPMDYATPTCIAGKIVALSGAGGKAATAHCREKLTELLKFIRADVIDEPQTGIALTPDNWASDTLTLSDEQSEMLRRQADALLARLG